MPPPPAHLAPLRLPAAGGNTPKPATPCPANSQSNNNTMPETPPATGLLLTGGGARAAYQVGVLEAMAEIRRAAGFAHAGNPFPVILSLIHI